MILHQIEALAEAGVTNIVLAVNYRPDVMVKALEHVRLRQPPQRKPCWLTNPSMRKSTKSALTSPSKPNPLGLQAH